MLSISGTFLDQNNGFLPIDPAADGTLGDFDGDGDVDGQDFVAWQRDDATAQGLTDWQNSYPLRLGIASTLSVPEPATLVGIGWAIAIGLAGGVARRS